MRLSEKKINNNSDKQRLKLYCTTRAYESAHFSVRSIYRVLFVFKPNYISNGLITRDTSKVIERNAETCSYTRDQISKYEKKKTVDVPTVHGVRSGWARLSIRQRRVLVILPSWETTLSWRNTWRSKYAMFGIGRRRLKNCRRRPRVSRTNTVDRSAIRVIR